MNVLGLLLAAGRGVRLAPLTDTRPKAALPLLDVPLGAWAAADLAGVVGHLIVNASAHAEVLEAALRPYAPGAEFMVELPDPWGSGGTVAALKERVMGVIVTRNADHLTDLRCADLLATHMKSGAPATVAIAPVLENGDFKIEGDHAVTLIDRRAADSSGDFLWIGSAVFDRSVLDLIPAERPIDLARGLLGQLVRSGELGVHIHRGYQLDVGSPSRFLRASIDLLYGRAPQPPVENHGEVLMTGGGRAYIGRNAHVREEWLGPDAIVLEGAEVPAGSFVSRTIVMPGERVTSDTTLSGDIWVDGHAVPARS